MSVETIRVVLGRLQEDPESASAWDELTEIVTTPTADSTSEIERLLEQARARHAERREWAAVARVIDLEVSLHPGAPENESMLAELARIYDEELADSTHAVETYKRLENANDKALREKAQNFLEIEEGKRAKWSELCDRYLAEAATASDASFRSVLFASAADIAYRYAGEAISREALIEYIEQALTLDAKNRRAALLAEIVYTNAGDYRAVARVLSGLLAVGASREDRVSAGLRVGRIYASVLKEKDLAIDAYQQVLDMVPGQPDALSYLAEAFSRDEAWDHLVALYEDQLKGGLKGDAELGVLLQIAMVHWRMRDKPEAAEPYFERLRRIDPTHGGMLGFFREVCQKRGDSARLVAILTDAQRATNDATMKRDLAKEIAGLAESTDNAQKAIEQYKNLLRADPDNDEAKVALRRLYTQTSNYAAIVELLRHDLEKTPVEDAAGRSAVLREIAAIHRDKQRNDQALVATLVQITHVDERDTESLRELVAMYEQLGRFRDLLLCQQKLAELTSDDDEKAELYRSAARRWGEQFSNVQNAITAYEGLLAVRPRDEEARTKLRELYNKRRSWAQLYSLYEIEAKDAEGEALTELLGEMAKLASERLDRGADAIALQKRILEVDPSNAAVFDAIEKQAEREKDFATLAEILEKRIDATTDDAQKLVLLQKLGVVYETRLKDPSATARTWKRVLDLQPGHSKALRVLRESYLAAGELDSLESLYEAQGDWENLADFLSSAADKAAPAQKITISFRAARVYEERLKAKERAARSYERVLSVDASNEQAARALVPLYEKEERWARLPALYEVILAAADDKVERVETLMKLAAVMGGPLTDKNAALGYARRAYELAPESETLELLESWSRAASSWGPFVEAVQARLKNKEGLDPALERQLKVKLADAYARELGKIDEAALVYKDLVATDPSDAETVRTFDALLRGAERREDLRWLFDMRVNHAERHERAEIYEEWATLEEDVFGNAKDAIGLYRKAIEIEPERSDALRALSRLLLAAGDYAGAAEIIARHRDVSQGEARAQREIELADLYLSQLGKNEEAFEASVRALELKPHDPDAITILAKLLDVGAPPAGSPPVSGAPKSSVRARAAGVLESEYRELGDARREAQVLAILMESEDDAARRLDLHTKLAEVEERQLSAPGTAFGTILRALNEFPDEIGLWDRASELGMKAGRPTDLAEAYRAHIIAVDPEAERRISRDVELLLCERAATLHDEQLGDADGAMPYLKRILVMDPTSDRAFERLKQILTASERWSELEELFEQAAQTATDRAQKISLLGEVALVAEEIMGDPTKAIRYHERILAIDPLHVASLDTLEKLYEDEERFVELGELLERRLESAIDDEAVDIRLYLGRLYLERLDSPERAQLKAEEILTARPEDPDARELAERLLEIEPLRLKTALLLETVYEVKDDIKNLVKMLEIRLGAAKDDGEKRELLRRISELRDERLHDDAGAFAALADRLPLDPEDEATRERFIDIGRKLGEHGRIAAVLSKTADATTAKPVRAEILMAVAALYEGPLGDVERAEKEYRKVIETDAGDPGIVVPAAKALARIFEGRGDNEALADILSTEVKLEESIDTRKALYERLGELYENTLHDPSSAIDAYKLRLVDDPADELALSALERLYESAKDYRELVRILRAREEASNDEAERRRAMRKAAETLSGPLDDAAEAINAWRAVLDAFGPERATLAPLAALYEKASRYADLAETLEVDLSLADDAKDRIELLARLGDTRRVFLHDLPGAIDSYRQALELDASDPKSRAALEQLLEGGEGEAATAAQRNAAEILHPLYEAEGENEKLLKVLEIEANAADSPIDRLEKIAKSLATAEGPLGDPARAYGYAKRAVRESVGEDSIKEHVATLERLTEATSRYEETRKLFESVVGDVLDGDAQQDMLLRIGELAADKAKDTTLAIEFYKRALESRADDKRALVALERLYAEKEGDARELLEVLRRRAEVAEGDDERKELLFREAEIQETRLEDIDGAIATLESILDIDLDPRATSSLESLYTARGKHTDLVALYERQLDVTPMSSTGRGTAASALRVKIARIARTHLEDTTRAFDELSAALDSDPTHAEAIAELESVLRGPEKKDADAEPTHAELEERARAAEMLEPVYLRQADWGKVKGALEARIAASPDPGDKIDLLRRLATLYEEQLEDYAAALATMAKILHEDVSDEAVWSELERLARVASASKQLAEIYASELEAISDDDEKTAKLARRTGEIYADLGDVAQALKWYRRVHSFEPESEELFDAIDGLLVKENRHEERVALYRAALDYRDGERRLALLHTIAGLEEKELGRLEDAVETYRAALDVEADDATSLDRLTELYKKLGRHRDLADLYLRRAESAASPEAAAPYRLSLARLSKETLGEKGAAIDQLEAIVTEVPWHTDAISELEALSNDAEHKARVVEILRPLYERADDWKLLVKLNDDRIALAEDPRDKAAILRETARLWETRGSDAKKAFDATRRALEVDPADGDTRAEAERLAKDVKAFAELAETYEAVVPRVSEDFEKRELLVALARVYDRELDDPRRALLTEDRLVALDPNELEPLDAIDELAVLLGDWAKVISTLEKKVEHASDADGASLLRRIAQTKLEMLEDESGASDAYERALSLEPDHASTIDRLIAIYEAAPKAEGGETKPDRLVELYARRVELAGADEADLRYDLNMRAARRLETSGDTRKDAIASLAAALEAHPGDRPALSALERLYRAEEMWHELLENLREQAGLAETMDERTQIRVAIGNLHVDQLSSPEEALEQYRLVLDEDPRNEEAARRAKKIADEQQDLRLVAADILLPVLRAAGKHAERVEVLELKLTAEDDPTERATTLKEIAAILDAELGDPSKAESALLRALGETPEDEPLHEEIERLAARVEPSADDPKSGGFARYADALEERASGLSDAIAAKGLFVRLGRITEEKLDDAQRAVTAYAKAVEHAGDEPELLAALDRLHGKLGNTKELADVLERRIAVSTEADQAELYYRLARLQIDKQREPVLGLGSLRSAIDRDGAHAGARAALEELTDNPALFEEVAETLENVYRQAGDNAALAKLYEKRIRFAPTKADRVRMRLDLSRVLEDRSSDAHAALGVLQGALEDDPGDSDVLAEIERLAAITDGWKSSAEALEKAIAAHDDVQGEQASDLWMRAAQWRKDKVRDLETAEADFSEALKHDPQNVVILRAIEELQRSAGREKDLVETLRRIAKLESSETAAGLRREAKGLAVTAGDDALAESILREMIAADEADAWALAELTATREKAEDWKEVYTLLVRRAELAADGDTIRDLRREAGTVARDRLGDDQGAIDLFEQIFEDLPTDDRAPSALRGLYAKTGRKKDLLKLLARLVDVAETAAARSALRIEAATVCDELESHSEAIDHLRAALDEEPSHRDATLMLSRLLEKTGRDEELAELLTSQIALAAERGDRDAELSYRVRLGEVYESRLGNVEKAIETYAGVLERDEKNLGALLSLARLHEKRGEKSEAAKVLERTLDVAEAADALGHAKRLAQIFADLGDDAGTRRALERGLGFKRDDAELREKLRSTYEKQKAHKELAELITEDARAATETGEKVRLLRAAADIHTKQLDDAGAAATLLAEASELVPNDRELLLTLCDAYSASGRAKQALEALQKIVESFGGRRAKELAPIHHRLAKAYLADGDRQKALAELDSAFKLDPGSVAVLRDLGVLSLELADAEPAQKDAYLDRAGKTFKALLMQKLDGSSAITKAEVFFFLGQTHHKKGDDKMAVQMLERALDTDKNLEKAKTLLAELKK